MVRRGGEKQKEDRCVYKKATLGTTVMTESLSTLTVRMATKTYTGDKITSPPARPSVKRKKETIARGR